jgi:hypothetical protein
MNLALQKNTGLFMLPFQGEWETGDNLEHRAMPHAGIFLAFSQNKPL